MECKCPDNLNTTTTNLYFRHHWKNGKMVFQVIVTLQKKKQEEPKPTPYVFPFLMLHDVRNHRSWKYLCNVILAKWVLHSTSARELCHDKNKIRLFTTALSNSSQHKRLIKRLPVSNILKSKWSTYMLSQCSWIYLNFTLTFFFLVITKWQTWSKY